MFSGRTFEFMADTAPETGDTVHSGATDTADSGPAPIPQPPAKSDEVRLEDLPESWQTEIKNLRNEAAKYRTRAGAKDTELSERHTEWTNREAELNQKLADSALSLARYRAAALSGVPVDRIDDFASRLRGSTEDELVADAAQLAEMFGANSPSRAQRGVDPSQGRGNNDSNPSSPQAAFAAYLRDQLESR